MQVIAIPTAHIKPNPNQPRRHFRRESLDELAQSLKEHGQLQPIVVELDEDGSYLIVAGERRWRAAKLAGLKSLDATVRDRTNHNGAERLLSAIIENVQREDMNVIDEGEGYQNLVVAGMTVSEIHLKTGKAVSHIYACLSRLELAPEVIRMMRIGELSADMRVVNALKSLDAEVQVGLAKRAVEHHMKIDGILTAIRKVRASLSAAPIEKNKRAKSPAMQVARTKYAAMHQVDDLTPPTKWNALKQLGEVPAWTSIVDAANAMCGACSLKGMASNATCSDCPGVDLLGNLAQKAVK